MHTYHKYHKYKVEIFNYSYQM